jgi:hypothetical protein
MRLKTYFYYPVVICFLGCGLSKTEKEKNIELSYSTENSSLGMVSLKLLSSIGSDNPEEKDYIFSDIYSLQVDKKGNLYVLDRSFRNIRLYDSSGVFIREYVLQKGQGPGEFLKPMNFSLSADNKRIYIADMFLHRLSIFDVDFNYLNSFQVKTFYFEIYGGSDGTLITLFNQLWLRPKDFFIHKFNEKGNILTRFGLANDELKRINEKNLQMAFETYLALTDSLLITSFGYPYEIRVYNLDGRLLHKFARKTPFYGGEYIDGEFLFPTGASCGLAASNTSLILNFVRNNKTEETFVHAFDFEGKIRGHINMSESNVGKLPRLVTSTTFGNTILFIKAQEPYPRILKFQIVSSSSLTNHMR